MSRPVERTSKIVTSVQTLPEAWAFIMEHIESVGPRPQIHISPITIFDASAMTSGSDECEELFEVSVSGMVEDV